MPPEDPDTIGELWQRFAAARERAHANRPPQSHQAEDCWTVDLPHVTHTALLQLIPAPRWDD